MLPWTEGCQAPILAPPLNQAKEIKNTLNHGADKKKIEPELECKKVRSSFNGSAPVVCAFFPDYMRDNITNSKPECLKKNSHKSEIVQGENPPNLFEEVTIEDWFEYETATAMSGADSNSSADLNSASCPPTNLEHPPLAENDKLTHQGTQFIFNVNKNCFEPEGKDKASPMPVGDDGKVKVQIEQENKQCDCV